MIDVGANVGQFAVAAARLLMPAALYSFEPLPGVVKRLEKNLSNVSGASAMALGDREGSSSFRLDAHSHSSSILPLVFGHRAAFPAPTETEPITVPTATLTLFSPASIWRDL